MRQRTAWQAAPQIYSMDRLLPQESARAVSLFARRAQGLRTQNAPRVWQVSTNTLLQRTASTPVLMATGTIQTFPFLVSHATQNVRFAQGLWTTSAPSVQLEITSSLQRLDATPHAPRTTSGRLIQLIATLNASNVTPTVLSAQRFSTEIVKLAEQVFTSNLTQMNASLVAQLRTTTQLRPPQSSVYLVMPTVLSAQGQIMETVQHANQLSTFNRTRECA